MKKDTEKETAMAKHPAKETASAKTKASKPSTKGKKVDIEIISTPMEMKLGYHPGEVIKGYDANKAKELIDRGYAKKL